MLGKILDFICTRLRSTEIALDSLSLVQYDFCRTKTRANKIPYFTKHCRITYNYFQLMKIIIDKFNQLACIRYKNQNAVALGCRDIVKILRPPQFQKSQSYRILH